MLPRIRHMLLCVALIILSISEAAVNRPYGSQRSTSHYSHQGSVLDRRGSPVSHQNPLTRQRVYLSRTQNSPLNRTHNRHLVQSPTVHPFSRQRMNRQRLQYFPPVQPYNHQRIQSYPPQTYQNYRNRNHGKLNYQWVPHRQQNPRARPLPQTATMRRVLPLTRNNKHGPGNLNVNSSILSPPVRDRVGKQLVFPRKFIQASQNTQEHPTLGSQHTGQSNGTNHTCTNGKIWRNGQCVCPYLANWDANQTQCICIYGTYRHSEGDCRNY